MAASSSLADLEPGQRGVVAGFLRFDAMVQRVMQLGLLEGTEVQVLRRAPAGDPIEIQLLGYSLSLRRSEARVVRVEDVR